MVRVNRTFVDWTGLDRKDLLSERRFQDLLTNPGRIFWETHVFPLLRMQGRIGEITLDLALASGASLPVLLSAALLADPSGQPLNIRMALVDITDRRRYERELLFAGRNAERLAAVVSHSSDAVMLLAPDGTIQSWNRGAERMFGYLARTRQSVGVWRSCSYPPSAGASTSRRWRRPAPASRWASRPCGSIGSAGVWTCLSL